MTGVGIAGERGIRVSRKRVQRQVRIMGLRAIYRRAGTSFDANSGPTHHGPVDLRIAGASYHSPPQLNGISPKFMRR